MKKIGVLASGTGSNFLALVNASREGKFDGEIACLISDKKNAPVLEKASNEGIPSYCVPFDKAEATPKETFEKKIHEFLESHQVDLVVLAGFMRILSEDFLEHYENQKLGGFNVVNIHPTLLPALPGKDGYERAWVKGLRVMGCTVHYVDKGVDSGPIILQKGFEVSPWESLETVKEKGIHLEHLAYAEALELICSDRVKIETRVIGEYSEKVVSIFH